jgi:hypothetical protein
LIAAGVMVRTPRFNAQLRAYRPKGRKSLHRRHYANYTGHDALHDSRRNLFR